VRAKVSKRREKSSAYFTKKRKKKNTRSNEGKKYKIIKPCTKISGAIVETMSDKN
jgi:hypothetical protein